MKRIVVALIVLLLASSVAFGYSETTSVSGTTTLTWGFEGQLLDNQAEYLGYSTGAAAWATASYDDEKLWFDIFSSASDKNSATKAPTIQSSISVTNSDGLTIFKATTSKITNPGATANVDWNDTPGFGFSSIEFPNLVPNMVALKLVDNGFSVTATPLPANGAMDASVTLGVEMSDPIAVYATDGTFTDSETALGGTVNWWVSDLTNTFAIAFDASFGMDLNKDDSISVALGTEFDTAWGKAWKVTTASGVTTGELVAATASTSATDIPVYADGDLWGWTSIPFDLSVDAAIADASIGLDFETVLVNGIDVTNLNETGVAQDYALPFYLNFDAAYEMILGDEIAAAEFAAADGALVDAKQAAFAAEKAVAEAEADLAYANSVQGGFDWENFVEDFTKAFAAHQAAVAVEPASTQVTTETTAVTGLNDNYGLDSTAMTAVVTAAIEAGEPDFDVLIESLEAAIATAEGALETAEGTLSAAMDAAAGYPDPQNITISPNVNFQYSSDFWKWGIDNATYAVNTPWAPYTKFDTTSTGTTISYFGDVSAAGYLGRPMSFDLGVDVDGIAGLLDVSLSGGAGFGDAEVFHGSHLDGGVQDSEGLILAADGTTATGAVTLADHYTGIGVNATGETASDSTNNRWLAADALAYGLSLGLTVGDIVDGLTISNMTDLTYDGLLINGLVFAATGLGTAPALPTQLYHQVLSNSTGIDYEIMVGESLAFTIFADVDYDMYFNTVEQGEKLDASNLIVDSEAETFAELNYKAGLFAKVSW